MVSGTEGVLERRRSWGNCLHLRTDRYRQSPYDGEMGCWLRWWEILRTCGDRGPVDFSDDQHVSEIGEFSQAKWETGLIRGWENNRNHFVFCSFSLGQQRRKDNNTLSFSIMSPTRHTLTHLQSRRRSSIAKITKAKYTQVPTPARLTFYPNVTPTTYVSQEQQDAQLDQLALAGFPSSSTTTPEPCLESAPIPTLFPPSLAPSTGPTRKRRPPGKRPSQGYIPRPPNAFMLFRADFVRQKHVPGSIETNHGSLSKIIGTCFFLLPMTAVLTRPVFGRLLLALSPSQRQATLGGFGSQGKASPQGALSRLQVPSCPQETEKGSRRGCSQIGTGRVWWPRGVFW